MPFNSETGAIAGRKSKRKSLDTKLAEMADSQIVQFQGKSMTKDEMINQVLIDKASLGKIDFVKEYNNRRYGKAKQKIELEGSLETKNLNINSNMSMSEMKQRLA